MKFFSIPALVLFLIISCLSVNGQVQVEFNQNNDQGQKVGKWKGFYENGAVRYVGQFEKDAPQGTFYHYYGDGKLQTKMVYRTSKEAFATMYYSSGEKLAQGKYIDKLKDSVWITFGSENRIVEMGSYSQGKKEGKWVTFYETGEVSVEINFEDNLKDGLYRMFYENGQLKDSSNFKEGKLHGYSVIYNSQGKKVLQGVYNRSKRDKNWVYYGENQKVDKVLKYIDGQLMNPEDLKVILEDAEEFKGNRKDILEFEDLRGTISYE